MKNFEEWLLEKDKAKTEGTDSGAVAQNPFGFGKPKEKKKKKKDCGCGGDCCSKH